MKLQTKFNLGIVSVFVVLAVAIGAMSVSYANTNTIREAENRVRIYASGGIKADSKPGEWVEFSFTLPR